MSDRYFQHTFANGLTLLCEKMPGMQSAAMTLLVVAGASSDPDGAQGSGSIVADMVFRGAGDRDNRALTEHLDSLGLQRSSSVGVHHTRFGASALAAKVIEALPTYADILMRPQMPADGFEASRDLALQALAGLDDDPRHKLSLKLREWYLPAPLGRSSMGKEEDLKGLTLDRVKSDFGRRYQAKDAILSIAGNIDFDEVRQAVGKSFGEWVGVGAPAVEVTPPPGPYHFEETPSEQTHIGIAYGSVPETHDDYYTARLSLEILGGGMSSRLFTEIREKRALCYSVGANYGSLKGLGSVYGYAGSSNERAQATLDTFIAELHRLSEGVKQDELDRAKIGLKASTIMSGESTSSRAGTIAHDYFMRGRIRTMDEISNAIGAVTLDRVNAYLKNNPPGPFTIVIVGPKELKLPA